MGEVVKLRKTSLETVMEDLAKIPRKKELYVVIVAEKEEFPEENELFWLSTGNKSRLEAIGALEYIKSKLY